MPKVQMTTLGYGLLLPTFVQIVLKQPATDAGVVLLPGAIVGAVFAPIGGLILDRLGAKKPIVLGLCCSFIATFCFLFFFKNLTYQSCILFYFIYSLGIGLIVGNTMTSAMSHLPKNLQADGNATLQTLMQLSGGIGTSITATILAFVQQGTNLYDGTNRGALFVLIFSAPLYALYTYHSMFSSYLQHFHFGKLFPKQSAPEDVKSLLQIICGSFATKMA